MVLAVSSTAKRSTLRRIPIRLLPPDANRQRQRAITVFLNGCGGTGGWLAPHLARRAWLLQEKWKQLDGPHAQHDAWDAHRSFRLVFVDPDIVEMKNVLARQNFAPCDVGYAKAKVLALRYSLPWGIHIEARVQRFDPSWIRFGETTILVDCTVWITHIVRQKVPGHRVARAKAEVRYLRSWRERRRA